MNLKVSAARLGVCLSFILLCTNSPTMALLQFPSHRVLTETNHASNINAPFLSHNLQAEQAELSLPFLIPSLCLHLPSLSLLIFPPLALLPASLRHTRVPLSFGSEGCDERQREAEEEKSERMQWSVLTNAVRKKLLTQWKRGLKKRWAECTNHRLSPGDAVVKGLGNTSMDSLCSKITVFRVSSLLICVKKKNKLIS